MLKKITFADISHYLINEDEPYEFSNSNISTDSISTYFNQSQRINVFHKDADTYGYEFQEIVDEGENKERTEERKHLFLNLFMDKFYTLFFLLFPMTIVFTGFFSLFMFLEYALIIGFLVSSIISTVISIIVEFCATCAALNHFFNFSIKSNNTAEQMISNFIVSNHRIPENMNELKKSSRFYKDYRYYKFLDEDYFTIIVNTLISSVVCVITNLLFICIGLPINLSFTISMVLFFLIYILFLKKQICIHFLTNSLMVLENHIINYSATTKNVTKESLIMAYIAASHWFIVTHPEEFNIDSYHNFLNSEGVIVVYECDTPDQPY